MPKRGENIRKRKDGRWEGRYICDRDVDGRAKYRSLYANSYSEIRQLLVTAKEGVITQSLKPTIKTFEEVAVQWLSGCSLRLKSSTIVKYTALLENHILPRFKNTNVNLISEDSIAQFIKIKSIDLSNSTIRSLLTIIQAILKYARKQGWYNNSTIELRIPSEPKKVISSLSITECKQLENFLLNDMDMSKLGIFLCLYTGLRVGELCALRWGDIDMSDGVLRIRSTLQRIKQTNMSTCNKTTLLISTPKSAASIRDIPLPSKLVNILSDYAQNNDFFLLSSSTTPIEPRTIQYRFKKYARQLGLTYSNPHVLRHTFATRCIELGFDTKTLSELLGHSRVEITLNRYVHSSYEHKRNQMALLFDSGQNYGHKT